MTESAGAVISEMRAQRDRAMARVKEFEAELAMKEHLIRERDSLDRDAKYWYKAYNDEVFAFNETLARAEKAEAEVERLKEENADLRKTSISPENEGGGRESGDGPTGNVPRRPGNAAANSAALWCHEHSRLEKPQPVGHEPWIRRKPFDQSTGTVRSASKSSPIGGLKALAREWEDDAARKERDDG